MKNSIFFLLILLTLSGTVSAQYYTAQNSRWCFGYHAGVDFSSGTPTAFTASNINTNEGSASIADASGNLLFYTDGKRIWNSTGSVMTGGTSVASFGTSSSTQGALIIPVLGSSTQYYVFSLEEVSFATGYCHLVYCIVDMSLSGGLGAVTGSTSIAITQDLGEKMTAIQGSNCDIWLITHRRDSTKFLAYNISSSGLSTTPVVSTVGAITAAGSYGGYGIGVMVAAPNSRLICTQSYNSGSGSVGTELYDFDPSTGVVSNLRVLDSTTSEYGAEFSPNSQFLYTDDNVGSGARISQYDVTGSSAATIRSTRTTIASGSGYPQMKLAPDGKIYFPSMSGSSTAFLDVIANPNVSGSGCGFSSRAVRLNSGTNSIYGMPNAIIIGGLPDTTYFTRDTTICIAPGDSISLTARLTGTTYLWENGDTTPTRFVHGPGTYICDIFTGCHVDEDTIHVIEPPVDTTVYNRSLVICIPPGRTITLSTIHSGATYLWDDGSVINTRGITAPGTYTVQVRNACHIDLERITVSLTPPDTTRVRHDSTRCIFTAPLTLNGRPGLSTYRWQSGSTASSYSAATSGTYYVISTDTCRNVFIDTFIVTFRLPDTTMVVKMDTTLCISRGALRLDGGMGFAQYNWSTGSTSSNISVMASGTYWVQKQVNCSLIIDTFKVNYIPVPTLSLGPDLLRCVGDTVTLASVQPAGTTYLWNNGSTGTSIQVYTTGTYWLTLYNGCVITDSVNITVSPYPMVNLGRDTVNCYGQPILLQSAYAYTTPFYLWSTGANTDTTTVTATGMYWLQVTELGCSTLDSINVTIYFDTFTLYNRDTAICLGKQVQAFLTANPAATFQWLPTAGITYPNTASPLIKPDTTAMYKVLISLASCPVLVDSFLIDVQPNPTVYAGGNLTICQFDTIKLHAAVSPDWYTGYWYDWSPNVNIDNFAVQDPIYTAGTTQKYIVTVSTSAGCIGKDSTVITVNPGNFAIAGANKSLCPGDSVQFSITGGLSYRWIPSMYVSDSTIGNPWVSAITNQHYLVIATDINGCTDTAAVNVTVFPNGTFFFEKDSIDLYPGESVHLQPLTNCSNVTWFPPVGLDNPLIIDPNASPTVSTRYAVTGVTEKGCIASDTIYINIHTESVVKTPNAFVPGQGSNSKFHIDLRGEAKLNHFRIYNRWGNLVFETTDISEGWDGNYNGKPQPFGVYVYDIEAVTSAGQLVSKHGNLTLIR